MKIVSSVIVGFAVCILMIVADVMFAASEDFRHERSHVRHDNLAAAIVVGALIGLINYFVPSFYAGTPLVFLSPFLLVTMVCFYIYLMYWWNQEGSNGMELIPFVLLAVVSYLTTKACAIMTAGLLETQSLFASLILVTPEIILSIAIGFFLSQLFSYLYMERGHHDIHRLLAYLVRIFTVLAIVFLLATRVGPALESNISKDANPAETVVEDIEDYDDDTSSSTTSSTTADYGFYNLNLQVDSDPRNDYDFGPNPFAEGATAKDYDRDLRIRMANDPALEAGDVAWLDAIVGTRYLGEFYESCKGDWAKTINLTKERFMVDASLRYQTLNAFYAFLDTAEEVVLEYQASGLDDQMYMNPHTLTGVPDVIVMTTTEHSGYFLTYKFNIKGNIFKVSYRIDCGYQPTNVQEVMHIVPDDTPRSNPNPNPSPTPKPEPETETEKPASELEPTPKPTPTPTPTPKPEPETEPKPTPTPETEAPKKDPTKSPATNTGPNVEPGPGPSTNNGVGAQTSTADQPSNSDHMDTPEEYREAVEDLEVINSEQKTGNDPSIPSTPPVVTETVPAPATVDSNAGQPSTTTPTVTVDNCGDSGSVVETPQGIVEVEPINTPSTDAPTKDTVTADSESVGNLNVPD